MELYELINLKWKLGIITFLFVWFCWVSRKLVKLLSKLISLVKLHVVKCKKPYLPDGYTVTSNVLVYSWIYDNFCEFKNNSDHNRWLYRDRVMIILELRKTIYCRGWSFYILWILGWTVKKLWVWMALRTAYCKKGSMERELRNC